MHAHAFHKRFDTPFDTGERVFAQPYLLYAAEGAFNLETAERSWLLLPHRAALIRAQQLIRIWTTGPAVSASVLFDSSETPALAQPCQVVPVTPLLAQMIQHAMRWDATTAAGDAAARAFFPALAHVAIEAALTPDRMWYPKAQSADLRRAIAYTLAELATPLRFEAVAAHALASERTLARRFRAELGMSWQQFLQRARLLHAAKLLALSQQSVADIAYATGISSASALAAQFQAIMGETPTQYRHRTKRKQA